MSQAVLSQLAPFNEHRFDACITYLANRYARSLTQYDIVKLHVLIDVVHVINHGQPVIGGQLSAWEHGPVVQRAYNRILHWHYRHEETGQNPPHFTIAKGENKKIEYTATGEVNLDDFSEAEIESMLTAWYALMKLSWQQREELFHGEQSYLGRAWKKARTDEHGDREISWDDVVDEYAGQHGVQSNRAESIKRAIRL